MNKEEGEDPFDSLRELLVSVKGVTFEAVIDAVYGVAVLPFKKDSAKDLGLLHTIEAACRSVCADLQASPIKRPRPNEVGNDIEPFVMEALRGMGLDAS